MTMFDLFAGEPLPQQKVFFDYAEAGDKAGALRHLQTLSLREIELQVLKSGFSMISTSYGKAAILEYAINQIGKREPVRVQCDW
jgi:hypothetical protein